MAELRVKLTIPFMQSSVAQFQKQLYSHVDDQANAVMELVNALSDDTRAPSVVELSLNPLSGRH